MPDGWNTAKALLNQLLAVLHALAEVSHQVQCGVGWKIPPLPEAHYLVPIPLLDLNIPCTKVSSSLLASMVSESSFLNVR